MFAGPRRSGKLFDGPGKVPEVFCGKSVGRLPNCCLSIIVNCCAVLKTNIPDFRKSEVEVYRRFSDFLGLHEKLVEKHLHRGCIIPPPPEKSVIGNLAAHLFLNMRHGYLFKGPSSPEIAKLF